MPEQPPVRVGQVWADNDPRQTDLRTLRVTQVENGGATCVVVTPVRLRGRVTTISVSRFRRTSSGYRLVEDLLAEGAP